MSPIFSLSRLPIRLFPKILFLGIMLLCLASTHLKAVETVTGGNASYNTTDNIGSSLTSWNTGWGSGGDGWNYVGQVSDASGVYLGNNWVLTAAHVNNPASFTLNGNVYAATGVSYTDFTNSLTGLANADLHLFQISNTSVTGTNIGLSNLTLSSSVPSYNQTVVMIGYGGANGQGSESWGINTVQLNTQYPISVNGYESIDFTTLNSGRNYASVVNGDSGGGDFIKIGSTWQLAGITEAIISYTQTNPLTGTNYTGSAFVQLDEYSGQISSIVNAVPEPSSVALVVLSLATLGFGIFRRSKVA
jgi:hypothetical protein